MEFETRILLIGTSELEDFEGEMGVRIDFLPFRYKFSN